MAKAQKKHKSNIVILGVGALILVALIAIATGNGKDKPNDAKTTETQKPIVTTSVSTAESTAAPLTETEPTAEAATPASTWIDAGMYKAGDDIPAGEYFLESSGSMAYFAVSSDSSGNLDSIIANDNINTFCYFTVKEGEYVEVERGRFIAVDQAPALEIGDVIGEGMYRVGIDIPAGEYKLECSDGQSIAYLSVSTDSRHVLDSIITNDNFSSSKYITVNEGQYMTISHATATKTK